MFKTIAQFYILAMMLSFLITLFVGATGASYLHVFSAALLAWPLAGFVLLTRRQVVRIRSRDFQH